MKIRAVRQERLYLKVAEQLSSHIDKGSIAAGARLPSERDLAEQFGVSRPTIREAMIALEIAGRVEIRSGSGVYVRADNMANAGELPDDAAGPLDLLEARYFIEGDAAALAAERANNDDLEALEEALHQIRKAKGSGQKAEEADERFHLLIAKASRNSALHGAVLQLWQQRKTSAMSVFFHQKLRNRGIKPVIRDHRVILDAIRQKDPEAARSAMRHHLQSVIDVVVTDDDAVA